MSFTENLRFYRNGKGLSQQSLADSMGVTKQTILKWENNKTYPTIFQLLWLADFFDCTPNDLLLHRTSFDVYEAINTLHDLANQLNHLHDETKEILDAYDFVPNSMILRIDNDIRDLNDLANPVAENLISYYCR